MLDEQCRGFLRLSPKVMVKALGRGQLLFRQSEGPKEVTNSYHLVFRQVAISIRAKGDGFAFDRDGPIATVRLVNYTKTCQQRAHVVPLNVVIQWVTKQLLSGNAVVMVQLDRHSQPPSGLGVLWPLSTIHPLGGTVKACDKLHMLGHRKEVKCHQRIQCVSAS